MRDEYFWSLFVLLWAFGWATVWYLRRRAHERDSLKLRELVHSERMAAIDKGVPLPEIPAEDDLTPTWLLPEADRVRANWLRRLALVVGLLSLFTGIGMCVAFYFAPDRDFFGIWTIGLIPAMGGVGFLLYAVIAAKSGAD